MAKYKAQLKLDGSRLFDIEHHITIEEDGDVFETHYVVNGITHTFDTPRQWDKTYLGVYKLTQL